MLLPAASPSHTTNAAESRMSARSKGYQGRSPWLVSRVGRRPGCWESGPERSGAASACQLWPASKHDRPLRVRHPRSRGQIASRHTRRHLDTFRELSIPMGGPTRAGMSPGPAGTSARATLRLGLAPEPDFQPMVTHARRQFIQAALREPLVELLREGTPGENRPIP
jgi:hypothetical protein